MSPSVSPEFSLPPAEIARIFRRRIVPQQLTGTRSDRPVALLVAGQPGAGKSAAEDELLDRVGGGAEFVAIDADKLRPYHPAHDPAHRADDRTAAAGLQPVASQWVSMAWDHCIDHQYNIIYSGLLRDPDDAAALTARLRNAGYRVELAVVAVHQAQSRLGILTRYQDGRDSEQGFGRYVPAELHDAAYRGVLDTVERVEAEQLVDAVRVFRRDGDELYTNRLDDGEWRQPPAARSVIETERARPWTPAELDQFGNRALALTTRLPDELRPELAAAARLAHDHVATTRDAVTRSQAAGRAFPTTTRDSLPQARGPNHSTTTDRAADHDGSRARPPEQER